MSIQTVAAAAMQEPASIFQSNLPLEAKLERARMELLDLSARNRLLNIPRSAKNAAFFSVDISQGGRTGYLVEIGDTKQIFEAPREELTKQYISGQFS